MCGIAGYAFAFDATGRPGGRVEEDVLSRMAESLRHRGPDGEGVFAGDGAGLAFRRLAIVDREGGVQPMASADGSLRLVFNGEIYNHRSLRRELEAAGRRFRTSHSDAEALLVGYAEWGLEGVLERLDGMFAFAVLDARARTIAIARDRFGEKPLVYAHTPAAFAFASEPKALRPLDFWSRRIDRDALADYLALQYVPDPLTIHEGLRKLPPAHRGVWSQTDGALRLARYWSPPPPGTRRLEPRAAAEELRARLGRAVESRLESEVPLGVFLSGGIDSSAVAAFAPEAPAFTIRFPQAGFDESAEAARLASALGREHRTVDFPPSPVELLPAMAWHMDEPFADPAVLPLLALSRAARRSITVALGGDGADELFGGYARHRDFAPAPRWARLPRALRLAAGPLLRLLAPVWPLAELGAEANRISLLPLAGRRIEGQCWTSPGDSAALLAERNPRDTRAAVLGARIEGSGFEAHRRLDFAAYLPGALLAKADRASMAAGLELRSPFLDHTLVEFAESLTLSTKFGDPFRPKRLLRDALRGVLPAAVLRRRKRGFEVPVAAWLRGPLRAMAGDLLLDRTARKRGLFNAREVERLLRQHTSGAADRRRPLWLLLQFELWARYGANPPEAR
ncbi:MAG: asparagine synthase (glutamine-hydrolyzing) [Candidatus Sumerlaeia bacterium]|nr:asparagine synthase (glutamine-hydrolyzing) [Candidatus Sumerlaeia bacterium]